MALAIMVMKSSARQHDRRWTLVKRLRVGREIREYHRCVSDMSCNTETDRNSISAGKAGVLVSGSGIPRQVGGDSGCLALQTGTKCSAEGHSEKGQTSPSHFKCVSFCNGLIFIGTRFILQVSNRIPDECYPGLQQIL